MGYLIEGLVSVLGRVFNMIQLLILASVLISWFDAPSSNQLVATVRAVTEPVLRPLRRFTSQIPGPIDWAPMVLILIVIFLDRSLLVYLRHLAIELK